ncbi:MAG: hypothetical protein AAFU78_14925 [Cyanobacteria bacterium J06633_2]
MSEQAAPKKTTPRWLWNVMLFGSLFFIVLMMRAISALTSPGPAPSSSGNAETQQAAPTEQPAIASTGDDTCTEGILSCSINNGYGLLSLGIEARTDHYFAMAQQSGNARQYLAQEFLANKMLLEQAQVRYGSFGGDATQIAYVRDRLGDMTAILAAFEKINLGQQALGQGVSVSSFMDQANEIELMLINEFPSLAEQNQLTRVDPIQERELGRTEVATNEPE